MQSALDRHPTTVHPILLHPAFDGVNAPPPSLGAFLGHYEAATTFRYAHSSKKSQRDTLALLASPAPVALPEPEAMAQTRSPR
jgi:hypothetical protein